MARTTKKRSTGSVLLSRKRTLAPSTTAPSTSASTSSKASRDLIRKHHTLQKQLAQALIKNDDAKAAKLRSDIEASGGIETYQKASINGQSAQRGGDSSKLLMQWVAELFPARTTTAPGALHVLEVGSLSPSNAISKAPLFNVTRIDLNSQHPSIATQDFMERPLPASDAEKFDLISLSLVLNYVPDAGARGDMLVRTTQFLRSVVEVEGAEKLVPGLFLVLPAPCVTNSRYLHEKRLAEIMGSLGYALVKSKLSPKLVYGLWVLKARNPGEMRKKWKKDEVNPGLTRNNFAITMK